MLFRNRSKYVLAGLLSLTLAGPACVTGDDEDPVVEDTDAGDDAGDSGDPDATPNPDEMTELGGNITEDQTWSGDILVVDDVSVRNGAEITIEAGTTFYVQADVQFEFGWNGNDYAIFAEGTEEAPIVFRGETAEAGFWRGIIFRGDGATNSRLEHVEIHHAGGEQPALVQNAGFTLSNVTVNESGDVGVEAYSFRSGSEGLTVTASAEEAVVLTNESALANFPYGGEISDNTDNVIVLDFSNITTEVNVQDPGVSFVVAEGLSGRDGGAFNVSEGVEFLVDVDQLIEFGWNGNTFSFDLQGSAESPIVFDAIDPTPGSWRGIIVRGDVLSSSNINHVQVRYAGTNTEAAVEVRSGIRIQNLSVEESFHTGFALREGLRTGSENISILNTQGRAAVIGFQTIGTMPSGTIEGNEDDFIDVEGNLSIDATIRPLGAPYRVIDDISTRDAAEVMIEPGTVFYFAPDQSLEFGWNGNGGTVTAVGTVNAPIIFTSELEEAGAWEGVWINGSMTSNSTIAYAEFKYATTALTLRNSINVENNSFSSYSVAAIEAAEAADVADLLANNTFDGSGADDVID